MSDMNAELWRRIDRCFQVAVELAPERRDEYLDRACAGDADVRAQVESLLTADSSGWDLLDRSAMESAAVLLADETPELEPGRLIGRYEIIKPIGKGGMGEVYSARDQQLKRTVALKLLPLDLTRSADRLRRFRLEAETVSALNHPNIITVHELGNDGENRFIATEFVDGETLREHMRRGSMYVSDVLDIGIQAAGALAAAHRAGVIHRDIKPENIMLRPDGYVKVLDFGLAKPADDPDQPHGAAGEPTDLSSGFILGTLRYMSPEQAGCQAVDHRSDIFSLGVVMYEMLTGRVPFAEKDPNKLAESISKDEPASFDVPEVPGLFAIIHKMMCKDPKGRFQNADELIAELRKCAGAADHRGARRKLARSTIATISVFALITMIGFGSFKFLTNTPFVSSTMQESGKYEKWTTKAPISSARWYAEPAVLNNVLYVAGGWNVCTPSGTLESYDKASDTWILHASMHTARGKHGVGVLNGKLYAVGGTTGCGVYTADVEAYDPIVDKWSARNSLPVPLGDHVVAVANGKVYAIGGKSSDGEVLASNFEYDPNTDKWTERTPMPIGKTGGAAAVVDDIIYVIGGQDEAGARFGTVEAYDPKTNSWAQRRPMQMPRVGLAVAEVDGLIYALGGIGDRKEVEVYDPAADTWTPLEPMPGRRSQAHAASIDGSIYIAGGFDGIDYISTVTVFNPEAALGECYSTRSAPKAPMPTARINMAVGEIDGSIYVVGGYESPVRFQSVNEAYSITTDTWVRKAPLRAPREATPTGAAVVDGKFYFIGGNANGYCSDLNEVYDPKTDAWATKAPMPTPRCHIAVVAVDGLIYAIGGTNTSGSVRYATVEIYDPRTDTWSAAPDMPTARQDLAAVSLNGDLYAIGGSNPAIKYEMLKTVEVYDPQTGAWTTKSPMPTGRAGLGLGVLNGMVVALGGTNGEGSIATVEVYYPEKDTWSTLTNLPTPRAYASAVAVGDALYLFGGTDPADPIDSLTNNEMINIVPCRGKQLQVTESGVSSRMK